MSLKREWPVVVAASDADKSKKLRGERENLEATTVATVTEKGFTYDEFQRFRADCKYFQRIL